MWLMDDSNKLSLNDIEICKFDSIARITKLSRHRFSETLVLVKSMV